MCVVCVRVCVCACVRVLVYSVRVCVCACVRVLVCSVCVCSFVRVCVCAVCVVLCVYGVTMCMPVHASGADVARELDLKSVLDVVWNQAIAVRLDPLEHILVHACVVRMRCACVRACVCVCWGRIG